MSGCPSVKCRNTGSGYVKPSTSGSSQAAAESNKKLDELLAARAMQDTTYFPPLLHTQIPSPLSKESNPATVAPKKYNN